jgi:hypothetical protein
VRHLRACAPEGKYYEAMPPMPEMPADLYNEFAWEEEERHCNLFFAGEGSSGGGGARRDLIFERNDEEEATALAQAVAESEANLAAMAEAKREEQARAIAEVQAFITREAEQERAMTNWVILN